MSLTISGDLRGRVNQSVSNTHRDIDTRIDTLGKLLQKSPKQTLRHKKEYEEKITPLKGNLPGFVQYLGTFNNPTSFERELIKVIARDSGISEEQIIVLSKEESDWLVKEVKSDDPTHVFLSLPRSELAWGLTEKMLDYGRHCHHGHVHPRGLHCIVGSNGTLKSILVINSEGEHRKNELSRIEVFFHEGNHAKQTKDSPLVLTLEPLFIDISEGFQQIKTINSIAKYAQEDSEIGRKIKAIIDKMYSKIFPLENQLRKINGEKLVKFAAPDTEKLKQMFFSKYFQFHNYNGRTELAQILVSRAGFHVIDELHEKGNVEGLEEALSSKTFWALITFFRIWNKINDDDLPEYPEFGAKLTDRIILPHKDFPATQRKRLHDFLYYADKFVKTRFKTNNLELFYNHHSEPPQGIPDPIDFFSDAAVRYINGSISKKTLKQILQEYIQLSSQEPKASSYVKQRLLRDDLGFEAFKAARKPLGVIG